MPITVTCTCGAQFRVKEAHAGRQTKCPNCDEPMLIPDAIAAADAGDVDEADEIDDYSEMDASPHTVGSSKGLRSWLGTGGSGETLLGMNRTCGAIMLLLGFVMVLTSRGCSTIAGRSKSRANARYQMLMNVVLDRQTYERADIEEEISDLQDEQQELRKKAQTTGTREERDAFNKQMADLNPALAKKQAAFGKLKKKQLAERRKLQRGAWREQFESARDAALQKSTGSYWREWVFVVGTLILSIGLLAVGFTGQGSEKTISLIMIAIITFSIYIGGTAWLDSIFDSVDSSNRNNVREIQPPDIRDPPRIGR